MNIYIFIQLKLKILFRTSFKNIWLFKKKHTIMHIFETRVNRCLITLPSFPTGNHYFEFGVFHLQL